MDSVLVWWAVIVGVVASARVIGAGIALVGVALKEADHA